ncbi:hypothetical protein [Pseudonocardia sp.]|uniref:hypothetical protein n=1 Tax=Pseudonocardia sp. TaxID=60912 RepID=UPI003D0E29A2
MPIRSPHGRSAAYRSLWQWPLRSPVRLVVVAVLAVAAVVAVSIGLGSLRAESAPLGSPAGSGVATTDRPTAAATPSVLPPVPELTPTTLPPSRAPQEALQVASLWSRAWVRPAPGVTADEWLAGLRPYTSEEYLGVLAAVDPGNIPARRVTGEPRPVRVSPRSLQVEVPTDALTLRVLVVDTEQGWRVAGYERA